MPLYNRIEKIMTIFLKEEYIYIYKRNNYNKAGQNLQEQTTDCFRYLSKSNASIKSLSLVSILQKHCHTLHHSPL